MAEKRRFVTPEMRKEICEMAKHLTSNEIAIKTKRHPAFINQIVRESKSPVAKVRTKEMTLANLAKESAEKGVFRVELMASEGGWLI